MISESYFNSLTCLFKMLLNVARLSSRSHLVTLLRSHFLFLLQTGTHTLPAPATLNCQQVIISMPLSGVNELSASSALAFLVHLLITHTFIMCQANTFSRKFCFPLYFGKILPLLIFSGTIEHIFVFSFGIVKG